jgi:hypothetical protein
VLEIVNGCDAVSHTDVLHKCLLYGLKDSEKDVSPWRWSKEWVVISCTECRKICISSGTIGQGPLGDPQNWWRITCALTRRKFVSSLWKYGKQEELPKVIGTHCQGWAKGTESQSLRQLYWDLSGQCTLSQLYHYKRWMSPWYFSSHETKVRYGVTDEIIREPPQIMLIKFEAWK